MATILLVEDDIPMQNLYEGALQVEHEVIAVESAAAALKTIDQAHPDLIVLDLHLPDAPGTKILNYLDSNQDFSDIQVVVMTGFAHYRNQQLSPSVVQVLAKPVTTSVLLRTINAALLNKAPS